MPNWFVDLLEQAKLWLQRLDWKAILQGALPIIIAGLALKVLGATS